MTFYLKIKAELENKTAIDLHFNKLETNYPKHSKLVIINLVEEFGKESIIGDAFVKYLAQMDRNNLIYVQFDFHEHWYYNYHFNQTKIILFHVKT